MAPTTIDPTTIDAVITVIETYEHDVRVKHERCIASRELEQAAVVSAELVTTGNLKAKIKKLPESEAAALASKAEEIRVEVTAKLAAMSEEERTKWLTELLVSQRFNQ